MLIVKLLYYLKYQIAPSGETPEIKATIVKKKIYRKFDFRSQFLTSSKKMGISQEENNE